MYCNICLIIMHTSWENCLVNNCMCLRGAKTSFVWRSGTGIIFVVALTWGKWNNEDAATDWILRRHTAYALSSNVYFPHMSIIIFYLRQQYILVYFEHTLFLVVCIAEQNYDNAATSCWWNVHFRHYYLVSNRIWSQNINLFWNEISYSELKPAVMIQD